MDLDEILRLPQYSLSAADKRALMLRGLRELTRLHRERCLDYARLLDVFWPGGDGFSEIEDAPYLPVGLFKARELRSVPPSEVYKVLTSSGTTGTALSRIVLDRPTAERQARALGSIMTKTLGPKRLPMLILDSQDFLKDRKSFNARAAGILGLSSFGRDHLYALGTDLKPDAAGIKAWLSAHAGEDLFIFGLTFLTWRFCQEMSGLDLSRAVLVHGGGWKKLQEQAVSNRDFKKALKDGLGIERAYDFYGMVEQVGGVFLECERGYLHAPNFSEIVVRDPATWKPAPTGATGVIQALSLLPTSYPGHSLLTEDLGTIAGRDGCACGRRGTFFTVSGRVPEAQLRGCSDVYASQGARA